MPRDVRSVLLVDSNDDSRRLYAEYLRLQGVACEAAETTDEGLNRAPDADLVVTGIQVRGAFDGIELVRRLRADARTMHTPIVVLTACAGRADRERAEGAGCDVFLLKPCLPEDLWRALGRLLPRRTAAKARAVRAHPMKGGSRRRSA